MNLQQILYYYYPPGGQYSPSSFGDNLVFWLDASNTNTLMQENASTSIPITNVSLNNDPVGLVYDRGYHAQIVRADADTRRPFLSSDGNINSYLTFDGVDDYLRIVDSNKYLNSLHAASPLWSLAMRVRMGSGTDGLSKVLFGSNSGSTANAGIYLARTTGNKLQFIVTKASSGNAVSNYTTTAGIVEADGFQWVFIELNGVGAATGRIKIGSNGWETFSVAAGAAVDAFSDLFIGALNGPGTGTYLKHDLSDLIILNRLLTDEDVTNLTDYIPQRTSSDFHRVQWDIDFDADARIFADTAGTTPITEGATIQLIRSNQDSVFGTLNRQLTAAAAGSSPIWRDTQINGKATGEWDGVDDNLDFSVDLFTERGGKWTEFVVIKNDDATIGSNFLKGSSGYQVLTGSSYSGNSNNNNEPYFLLHTSVGGGVPDYNSLANQTEGYNILVFRRDGQNWSSWNALKNKVTGINAGLHMIDNMGEQFNPDFWTDGMIARVIKYVGLMTDSQVEAKIDELKTLYNL